MSLWLRLREILLILVLVSVFGTLGYMVIEGWPFFDALYMTVITIGTVGYGETRPLETAGRVFTIVLIFVGIGSFTYALSSTTAFWVEYRLLDKWEKRRMERRIAALRNHIIICGGGDSALHIARELIQTRTPFVIVEIDPERAEQLRLMPEDILYLVGDASDTDVLEQARIDTARGMIACLPTDKDNLFTVIEAREMNPTVRIVTRILNDDARQKFVKAGANAIVSSQRIGALRIASEMLRPHVVSVLDVMLRQPGLVRVQEMPVGPGGAGKTLAELDMQGRAGVTIFALREAGTGHHCFNPPPDRVLREGDVLIGCADPDQLEVARRVAAEGFALAHA